MQTLSFTLLASSGGFLTLSTLSLITIKKFTSSKAVFTPSVVILEWPHTSLRNNVAYHNNVQIT